MKSPPENVPALPEMSSGGIIMFAGMLVLFLVGTNIHRIDNK